MKLGEWIAKNRVLILLIGMLLLIPSVFGIVKTRVNYDLLSYLPDTLETVKGQDIIVDEFGTGAFAMCVIDGMPMKDVQKLADEFKQIDLCPRSFCRTISGISLLTVTRSSWSPFTMIRPLRTSPWRR